MLGQKIIHLETVDSTNNYAAMLISEGKAGHGTVILADEQTAGRGQRGAEWSSEPGSNLLMSLILTPDNMSVSDQFVLSEITALALCDLLRKFGIQADIKWPNDILVDSKKIAGVLIENQLKSSNISSSVIGIGLNLNQKSYTGLNATSLSILTGEHFASQEVLFSFLESFKRIWEQFTRNGRQAIETAYLEKMLGFEKTTELEDSSGRFTGEIVGVDAPGRLIVKVGEERRIYDLKEVRFIFQNVP